MKVSDLFQRLVALLLLLLFSPLLLAIALVIRLRLGGPVFFVINDPVYTDVPLSSLNFAL